MLESSIKFARCEALKISTLSTIDVNDLNKVAGLHKIGFSRSRIDSQIQNGLCEGIGERKVSNSPDRCSLDRNPNGRCGILLVGCHWAARGCNHQYAVALGYESLLRARKRMFAE